MNSVPDWVVEARQSWQWRGHARPPFAEEPGPGQVSVWDFPRPPVLVQDRREVVVRWRDDEVARTRRAWLVLETAHPPSVYLPWDDVARHLLQPAAGSSFCEWKGPARYWTLAHLRERLPGVAWSYPQPLPGAEALANCVAFYAHALDCSIDGVPVRPQPGAFYGGWITPELAGPFKGDPGTEAW
ncbi:MAG: DUF427 domain-containing protein [Pseudomonadota bacterium]|nr:DUF427 domain-containing protein [Pseudomonadota bacterium]